MNIVLIKNNKVTSESDIVVEDGKLPSFLSNEGWVEIEIREPILEAYEVKSTVEYDLSGINPVKTWKTKFKSSLADHRKEKLEFLSQLSFLKRREIIEDYKINNIMLGVVYTGITQDEVLTLVENFRSVYYTAETEIKAASTHREIISIVDNVAWPVTI